MNWILTENILTLGIDQAFAATGTKKTKKMVIFNAPFWMKYNHNNTSSDEIYGPGLEEVEDIFRSLALIGRSPPGEAGVVAGGKLGLADTQESPDWAEEEVWWVGPVCPLT